MGKFMYKNQPYGGASSYATSVTCLDKDGNESTVQVELNELQIATDALNTNLGGLRFGVDGDGNGGYYKADDSFVPFKKIPEGYSPAKQLSGEFSATINGGGSSWIGETDVTITFDPPFKVKPVFVDVWETSMTTKYFINNQVYCTPMQIEPDHCVVRIYSNIQWNSVNDFKWEAIAFYE